jgi:hypothetical protein
MPDHRPVAVIDLPFFAGRSGDDDAGLDRRAPAKRPDESTDAGIASRKAVAIDQVLPDRHRVAATPERIDDELSIGLARARARRAARLRDRARVGGRLAPGGRFWPIRVGGHLAGNCRFWCRVGGHLRCGGRFWGPNPRASASTADRNTGRFQIVASRFPPDPGGGFDAPKRPAQSPQRQDLLLLLIVQDVAHGAVRAYELLAAVNVSVAYVWWPVFRCRSMAGFGCPPRPHQELGEADAARCRLWTGENR